MSLTESITPGTDRAAILRFPVRRDGWDTVDFYLPLFIGAQAVGMSQVAMGISGLYETPPRPLALMCFWIIFGAANFVTGTITGVLRTWRRFAERYELTESEFILHWGYCRRRAPFVAIHGVHPIKICRLTTALKPALRIKFRKPIASPVGNDISGIAEYDILGHKWNRPLEQTWSIDVATVNPEAFLEELDARCPHLHREGPRMFITAGH